MPANFHRVLRGTDAKTGFIGAIGLEAAKERRLLAARDDIRACIRAAFRDVGERAPLAKSFLVEDAPATYRTLHFLEGFRPQPRFRGQGSHSYRTLNAPVPEHAPPQQVDLDDGTFLPTSFLNQGRRPALAAQAYFKVIDDALRPLCDARGWTLVTDKPSCVRVQLDAETHVDIALYAIPDEDYAQAELLEKSLQSRGMFQDSAEFAEQAYRGLPEDRIMLARRDGTWLPSDPRKLGDWFQGAVAKHGGHLRHVCRYLKAWRDFEWQDPEAGISSITLMAMAVRVFDENRRHLDAGREDEALLAVAERMPALLGAPIWNPVLPDQPSARLDAGWDEKTRRGYVEAAQRFLADLRGARDANLPGRALERLRDCLGGRVPSDHGLVEILPSEEEQILAQPRIYVPRTPVGRTTSG